MFSCEDCGFDLEEDGFYFCATSGRTIGETYSCPNWEGFSYKEEALSYYFGITEKPLGTLAIVLNWKTICCGSHLHYGSFYTDETKELYAGSPVSYLV